MIHSRYLAWLALATIFWCALYLAFTWAVDPYGVSPVSTTWSTINEFKPKRRDIDRFLKPYEVWQHKPRTVFLGSSRVLESIDPSTLDGSRFAPAYNASMNATTLSLDAAHIEHYIKLDQNLRFAFVELFFWNFVYRQPEQPPHRLSKFIKNSWALQVSAQALWDSILTLKSNLSKNRMTPYVGLRGNLITAPGHNPKPMFDHYVEYVIDEYRNYPSVELHPTAFQALDRIVQICRQNGVELYLLITPSHPYDDYRILSLGYWGKLERWHRTIATYPNVLSASQYTAPLTEPVSERMAYWNDPVHPSLRFGELVLRAFLREQNPDIPPDILVPVNESNVEAVLQKRRSDLEKWISENQDFSTKFEKAKDATGTGSSSVNNFSTLSE